MGCPRQGRGAGPCLEETAGPGRSQSSRRGRPETRAGRPARIGPGPRPSAGSDRRYAPTGVLCDRTSRVRPRPRAGGGAPVAAGPTRRGAGPGGPGPPQLGLGYSPPQSLPDRQDPGPAWPGCAKSSESAAGTLSHDRHGDRRPHFRVPECIADMLPGPVVVPGLVRDKY